MDSGKATAVMWVRKIYLIPRDADHQCLHHSAATLQLVTPPANHSTTLGNGVNGQIATFDNGGHYSLQVLKLHTLSIQ